jgi:hypothetical protein
MKVHQIVESIIGWAFEASFVLVVVVGIGAHTYQTIKRLLRNI